MTTIPQIKTDIISSPSVQSTNALSNKELRISIPGPANESKSLESRDIKILNFDLKKVLCKVAFCFAYAIVFVIYWFSIIGTAHGLYRMIKAHDPALKEAVEQIGKNRFAAIQKAVASFDPNTLSACGDLGKAVKEIHDLVRNDPGKDYHHYTKEIQAKTEEALLLPEYENSKANKANSSIRFLHLINDAILNETKGGNALIEYGNKILQKYVQSRQDWGFVEALDFAVDENHQGYRYDTILDKFTWSMAHPIRTWTKVFSDKELEYNACKTGNIYYHTHDLFLGNVKVQNSLGPGITPGNRLRANLQHLANEKNGIRFEHTLEHLGRKGEDVRKRKLERIQKEYPEQMRLIGTCLDGDIWSGKGAFKGLETSKEFHEKLSELLFDMDTDGEFAYRRMRANKKEDSGFYFPMLTSSEVAETLSASEKAFTKLENTDYYKQLMALENGRKRYVKAMDLSFNVMIFLKALLKEGKKEEMIIRLHQACKEDVDRGAIVNVLSALYEDLILSDKKMALESFTAESIGILLMRGLKANDRVIMKDRYEALSDLLHLIQEKPKTFINALRVPFVDDIFYFQEHGGIRREFS